MIPEIVSIYFDTYVRNAPILSETQQKFEHVFLFYIGFLRNIYHNLDDFRDDCRLTEIKLTFVQLSCSTVNLQPETPLHLYSTFNKIGSASALLLRNFIQFIKYS